MMDSSHKLIAIAILVSAVFLYGLRHVLKLGRRDPNMPPGMFRPHKSF